MIKNFDAVLTTFDGTPIMRAVGNQEEGMTIPMTHGYAIGIALTTDVPEEKPTLLEKAIRSNLAVRIQAGGDQEYTVEEVATMLKVAVNLNTTVAGQLYNALNA